MPEDGKIKPYTDGADTRQTYAIGHGILKSPNISATSVYEPNRLFWPGLLTNYADRRLR